MLFHFLLDRILVCYKVTWLGNGGGGVGGERDVQASFLFLSYLNTSVGRDLT